MEDSESRENVFCARSLFQRHAYLCSYTRRLAGQQGMRLRGWLWNGLMRLLHLPVPASPSHRVAVPSPELKRLGFCLLLLICADIGGACLLACQCGHSGQAEEYARSAAVFRGTVLGISRIPHLLLGTRSHLADLFCTTNPASAVRIDYLPPGIRVELEVDGIWKGELKEQATIRTGAWADGCFSIPDGRFFILAAT